MNSAIATFVGLLAGAAVLTALVSGQMFFGYLIGVSIPIFAGAIAAASDDFD